MKKKIYIACIALFVLVLAGSFVWYVRSANEVHIDPETYYPVTYVIDGDTFKVSIDGKMITIRVLGINTPETVDPRKPVQCFGPEASAQGKELLTGRKVELHFSPNRELTDKYGRYLAYVYRDDGLFYNEEMIKDGFAREYTVGSPYSLQAEFRSIESSAQNDKLGLWGRCPSQ